MSERKFKKNLGTLEDVTRRHTEAKRKDTKDLRNAKIQKKRTEPSVARDNVPDLIKSLSFNIESLPILYGILSSQSEQYYAPCEMFPEFKGPFLFENDKPIMWIASLLKDANVQTVQLATGCLVNISAHSKQLVWVGKIIPHLPILYRLLESHPDARVRENIIFILSNMCLDNVQTRNIITSSEQLAPIICKNVASGNWSIIAAAASLLKGIFIHRDVAPTSMIPLWNVMVHDIVISHFPAQELTHNVPILLDIILSIFNLVRYSDDYKKVIISDGPLISRICEYCRHESQATTLATQIVSRLSDLQEIHGALVKGGMIQLYVHMLNVPNPIIKIQGATGLANLAESVESFPLIHSQQVLHAIRMQFEYVDVSPVLEQLYYLINSIVLTSAKNDLEASVYPLMLPFVCRLSDALVLLGQNNLVILSIESLKWMLKWDKQSVLDSMEDSEALSRLDRLANHGNPTIQRESSQLMEWVESGADFMEEE